MHHRFLAPMESRFLDWEFDDIGSRSILFEDRYRQYFNFYRPAEFQVNGIAREIQALGCSEVGLDLPAEFGEYPIWVALQRVGGPSMEIRHVNVRNISSVKATKPPSSFNPCALVVIDYDYGPKTRYGDGFYAKIASQGQINIYGRLPLSRTPAPRGKKVASSQG